MSKMVNSVTITKLWRPANYLDKAHYWFSKHYLRKICLGNTDDEVEEIREAAPVPVVRKVSAPVQPEIVIDEHEGTGYF
jgi:hypothetical protein